ncbi:MAG: hypothetical protein II668_05670 [Oscillospiraceae bacterium]|nr:hypothetical protein [Oscillospiraceae bacterium]
MTAKYAKEAIIESSRCDMKGRLSHAHAFSMFQDIAGEHADMIGVSLPALIKRDLFWLTVRTKVRFYKRPSMLEPVTIMTWPEVPDKVRANRDYAIASPDGERLIEGKTEWAVLSISGGRPQPMKDIYPSELTFEDEVVLPEPFVRIGTDFSKATDFGAYTVRSTDIDLGRHMNNTAYVHALMGLFNTYEISHLDIYEIEVAFRSPTFEGQTIKYRRRYSDGFIDIGGFVEDKIVFLARITLRK